MLPPPGSLTTSNSVGQPLWIHQSAGIPSIPIFGLFFTNRSLPVCHACQEAGHLTSQCPKSCRSFRYNPLTSKGPSYATAQSDNCRADNVSTHAQDNQSQSCRGINRGKCEFMSQHGACKFSHSCSKCGGKHAATTCDRQQIK